MAYFLSERRFPFSRSRASGRGIGRRRTAPVASLVEILENRLLLFVPSGTEWPGTTITYSYSNLLDGNLGGSLTATQLRAAVEEAFTLWASYAPLTFVEQPDSGPAVGSGSYSAAGHPMIRFGHGAIDGAGPTLAQGFAPGTTGQAGDILFEAGNNWALDPDLGVDFLDVAVHEIGHALGLDHQAPVSQGGVDAIMNPGYLGAYDGLGTAFLFADDINGIRYIYGTGTGSVTPLTGGSGDDHSNSAIGSTGMAVESTVTGNLETGGDEDWFQFTAVAGTQYTFEVRLGTLTDSTLRLVGQDGTTSLDFDDDDGEGRGSLLQWTASASGTFFLKVKGFSTLDTGTYTVSITHNDDFGGTAANATTLSLDTAQSGRVGVAGDQDWFQLNVTAGETYRVLLDTQGLSHGRLTLYSSNGSTALLTGNGQGAGTDPWLIWKADATETVFISVKGNSSETGNYSISYTTVDGLVATTPGSNMTAQVRVFNASNSLELFSYVAYGAFTGGAFVDLGDVNGDGIADIITAANAGAGPHVRVVSGANGADLMSFYAYDPQFGGGVRIAAGDVNGDGKDDIITVPGTGGGPHIRVFAAMSGSIIHEFYAYSSQFTGGVYVASADVDDDGKADIITATGPGVGPHVRVISGADGSTQLHSFYAYVPQFTGGVFVASADVNDDGHADIITGPGAGGGPHVRVFDGTNGSEIAGFMAYDSQFLGGVRVGAADVNDDGHADIITGPGSAAAHVRIISGDGFAQLGEFFSYSSFPYGIFVAGAPAALTGSGSSPRIAASEPVTAASVTAQESEPSVILGTLINDRARPLDRDTEELGRPQEESNSAIASDEEEDLNFPVNQADGEPAVEIENQDWSSLPDGDWGEVFGEKLFNQLMV